MTPPLLLVTVFWAAAYFIAGWPGIAVMAVIGGLGELLLFWSER